MTAKAEGAGSQWLTPSHYSSITTDYIRPRVSVLSLAATLARSPFLKTPYRMYVVHGMYDLSMDNSGSASNLDAAKKRPRISQADIPSITLAKALRVPKIIAENYGADPTKPLDVAVALDVTPTSGGFRTLCGAAVGYGLTEGGPNAPLISLAPLGQKVVAPLEVDADRRALREAACKPTIAQRFYAKYDGSSLPPKNIAQNVLASFEVPMERTSDVYDLLLENARFVGFVKTIKDKEYLDTGAPIVEVGAHDDHEGVEETSSGVADAEQVMRVDPLARPADAEPSEAETPKKNAIFVGHGRNRKPMDQLLKILNEYQIPHKQAVDEPNRARPIPQKVAEVMRECGAAILVFTSDVEYFDEAGNSIWRPSENVSHELGAASVLYGDRIIVFKETGVDLPSNFSSVGYIEFEKDKLSEKGIELFRELVSMKIVSISVG